MLRSDASDFGEDGKKVLKGDLTAVTPQVKPLMMKTDATQTQPYPPSGGRSTAKSESLNGNAIACVSWIFGSEESLTSSAVPDILVFEN